MMFSPDSVDVRRSEADSDGSGDLDFEEFMIIVAQVWLQPWLWPRPLVLGDGTRSSFLGLSWWWLTLGTRKLSEMDDWMILVFHDGETKGFGYHNFEKRPYGKIRCWTIVSCVFDDISIYMFWKNSRLLCALSYGLFGLVNVGKCWQIHCMLVSISDPKWLDGWGQDSVGLIHSFSARIAITPKPSPEDGSGSVSVIAQRAVNSDVTRETTLD